MFTAVRNSLLAFGLFLGLWALVSLFFDPYIVPSPVSVLARAGRYLTADFLGHLRATLARIGIGLSLSFVLGTATGITACLLGITGYAETLLLLFQVIPGTVLGIILLLVFGIGSTVPVLLIIALTVPLIAVNTANTLLKQDPQLKEVVLSFKGSARHLITDLYLPSLVPAMKTNLTAGFVFALKVVVLGEFIAAQNGLGHLLNVSRIYFDMEAVYFHLLVILLLIVLFQILVNTLFDLFFKRFLQ